MAKLVFKSSSENLLHNSENFMGSVLVSGHTSISKSVIINNIHGMSLRFIESVIIRLIYKSGSDPEESKHILQMKKKETDPVTYYYMVMGRVTL